MAFLDNPAIILAHIRQSHVTSDDTGMCEMVLIDQDVDLEKCQLALMPGSSCGSTGSGSLSEGGNSVTDNHACDLSQSMDITSSWDFGIRRRSNTGRFTFRLWLLSRAGFLSGTPSSCHYGGGSQKACSALVWRGFVCLIWASGLVRLKSNCVLLEVVAAQVEIIGLDCSLLCEFLLIAIRWIAH